MQTSKEGLEAELNQELLATLSSNDQHEVDSLNDDIRRLKTENKQAFAERMRLEAQKNKLENLCKRAKIVNLVFLAMFSSSAGVIGKFQYILE